MIISRRSLGMPPSGEGSGPRNGPKRPVRGDVWLMSEDPADGLESGRIRPCLVVSPDELSEFLQTVLIAPMTTAGKAYPFRIPCSFQTKQGYVMLDRISAADRSRLVSHIGNLKPATLIRVLSSLQEMFAI